MTTITKGLLAAAICLVALILAPAAIPTDSWRQTLEKQLSVALGQPVRIGRLYVTLLPRAQLLAEDVEFVRGGLTVARMRAHPIVASLLRERIVVRQLQLEGIRMDSTSLASLLRRKPAPEPARLVVQAIRVDDATLIAGPVVLPDIDADILLGPDGRPRRIHASMDGVRVRLEILPTASGALQLALQAHDWTLPAPPRTRLDEVHATAILEAHRLEAWNVQARVGRGSAFGFLSVRWKSDWIATGEFSLRDVPLARLQAAGKTPPALEGVLQAAPRFVARAPQADRLLARLQLASDFVVSDAVVRKVDLQVASSARAKPRSGVRETRFERISGHVALRSGSLEFTGLEARTGALMASGHVSVGADRSLSGRLDAQMGEGAGLLAVPLRVSGTVDDPRLAPTAGAVAGAAIGSALMPGVGTALGVRAGQWAEDMLGSLRSRPRAPAIRDRSSPSSP
ncbi:MAG: hypothetical protein IT532_16290 [Burkholderiales bacterium]|nr:hypothetical protein [Burkholderiales bacterium]